MPIDPTPASVSPEVDAFLENLSQLVDDTFLEDEYVSEPMSRISRYLYDAHAFAVCGPDDLRVLMESMREAVARVDAFIDATFPVEAVRPPA